MSIQAQVSVSGNVLAKKNNAPIALAEISLLNTSINTTSNENGYFIIKNLEAGNYRLQIRTLGYVSQIQEITIKKDTSLGNFILEEDNLTLKEVVINAKRNADMATSHVIDRRTLDHMQLLGVTEATSLLPGGKTSSTLHLATSSSQQFAINGARAENGNAVFGVAVEVDGVRLANSSIPGIEGPDTRNIISSNIENIEIITGIPSVENGDMTNGMVKINTRKGKSAYIVDFITKPNTKQVALNKGFGLGKNAGVLNASIEHTRSIAAIASPYTAYARNGLALNYYNTFNRKKTPVIFNLGISGNLGGYNSKSDPDYFVNTYSKMKDNMLRANMNVKWLLNKKWISNIEATASYNYNNRFSEVSSNKSSPASVAALHTTQQGYFVGQTYEQNSNAAIMLIAPGYWYERRYSDNKVVSYAGKIKANWFKHFGLFRNNLMAGVEYNSSDNLGEGTYYETIKYAPTWRPYKYSEVAFSQNLAWFAENKTFIPLGNTELQFVGGVRGDNTDINGSEYGKVNSFSPRGHIQYYFRRRGNQGINNISIKAGWGKTVKLPSFALLYPVPEFRDLLVFAPGTTAQGETFYGYYTQPAPRLYNPELKWQHNIQQELTLSANVWGNAVTITAQQDRTYNPYVATNIYEPFTYKFTDQSNLETITIPINNRQYSIDQQTGIVTVTDKIGAQASQTVGYREYTRGQAATKYVNGSPVLRRRLNWNIDFKMIPAIRTRFRIDGNYYYYKGVEETFIQSTPNATINMADGNPYKYIGFYVGSSSWSNGSISKSVNVNLTATTHIPKLRLIFSARVECSLFDYSLYQSEYSNGNRGFVLDSRDDYTPSGTKKDIYAGNQFIGVYPEYYISFDDMQTKIPFAEKFLWAKDNDIVLYNELAKMVVRTNYNYSFNPNKTSFYYSANLNITKEIGNKVSVTFNAINFINNMSMIRTSWNDGRFTLFGSGTIPEFYYGLSLRLKL